MYVSSIEENIRTSDQPMAKDVPKDQDRIEDVGPSDGKRKASPIPLDDSASTSVKRHRKKTKHIESAESKGQDEDEEVAQSGCQDLNVSENEVTSTPFAHTPLFLFDISILTRLCF